MNLKVPFAEKDEAKKLGARWDAGRKVWYVQEKDDLTPFSKWSPAPHNASAALAGEVPSQSSSSQYQVGNQYVEQPHVCDCPPWEICDKCRAFAVAK